MTPGQGLFWPQGYNLNKLGRSPLGDATYPNIKALGPVLSDKKISHFPNISLCKTFDLEVGPFLAPGV